MNLLQGSPWLLAHRSMLKPNHAIKVSLYGQDYVMWQDAKGEVQALPNACPHMGAMLSEGWCVAKSDGSSAIACPFHALEFDRTGSTMLPGSNKMTKSLLKPLELIIQGDFIWSYGGSEPKIPIPTVLNEFASEYELAGVAGHRSIKTDLLTMLLNMHDYNHQNGTHRPLFEIESVDFKQFIDQGLHSHAYYDMPRAKPKLQDILKNPALLAMPKVIEAHLENYFPAIVVFHGEMPIGSIKQCHIFVPESETHTRTYVVVFAKFANPAFRLLKKNVLQLVETVVDQDADILGKLYSNVPHRIKINNEVGMDWVRRNFDSFPEVVKPNFSR
ncbi:MAG TPA: Rieske 2Fe-2S domain-containing protein [Leptolyngbya sp.]|jgi:phenylpropionate dioxygenase-like ring-hydroxylating dioxygenase large terminal subunit|nr:Rieske 2Fe-2S domain-containing protein [Leptolyngbya sp.]